MQLSTTFEMNLTIYKRPFNKTKLGSSTLKITLSKETDVVISGSTLEGIADEIKEELDGGIMINVQDPFMIDLLEPKAGNTVHNFLNELKFRNEGWTYEVAGNTTPPDTKNGYQVLVMGEAFESNTIETFAMYILDKYELSAVTIVSGNLSAMLTFEDLPEELRNPS